ncbi:hypothetical protein [Aliamphritea spongicola]|nr:hypothetical protein [Aliamphritea spongicola]
MPPINAFLSGTLQLGTAAYSKVKAAADNSIGSIDSKRPAPPAQSRW